MRGFTARLNDEAVWLGEKNKKKQPINVWNVHKEQVKV